MSKEVPILNFSDRGTRDLALTHIKSLRGFYKFQCIRCKSQRSLEQQGYYWGVCLIVIAQAMAEAWGDPLLTSEHAHEFFKREFLTQALIDRNTGVIKGHYQRSTTSLDVEEFSVYLEKIILFAAENLSCVVPPPIKYGASLTQIKKQKQAV